MPTITSIQDDSKDNRLDRACLDETRLHRRRWVEREVLPSLAGLFNEEFLKTTFSEASTLTRSISRHHEPSGRDISDLDYFIGKVPERSIGLISPCFGRQGMHQGLSFYAALGNATHVQFCVYVGTHPEAPIRLAFGARNHWPGHHLGPGPLYFADLPALGVDVQKWVHETSLQVFLKWLARNEVEDRLPDMNAILEDNTIHTEADVDDLFQGCDQ